MYNLLRRSYLDHLEIEIIYLSKQGVLTHRTILVTEIVNDKQINAFCQLRRTKRTFLIENILSASPTRQKKRMRYA
ncbi:hypothetical protein LCL95_16820 [Bacillus timonensis]|nr:hypothetical protein [Bacillus timonensis]